LGGSLRVKELFFENKRIMDNFDLEQLEEIVTGLGD
jgi:hypothetical protein